MGALRSYKANEIIAKELLVRWRGQGKPPWGALLAEMSGQFFWFLLGTIAACWSSIPCISHIYPEA